MADDYWVTRHVRGWQVKGAGNERATSIHGTQDRAWSEARARAAKSQGEAILTGKNGRIRARNTFGNDPHPPKG